MRLIASACFLALAALSAAQEPIKVLIVSGANNHDWEWTTPSLNRILNESGRFEVEVTYDPAKDLVDLDRLQSFDALLLDYNGPRWGEPAESNFLNAVRSGLGVSVVHAANNAFPGWEAYEAMVCHCWRQGTGHGRVHPFDVRMEVRDHPITRTLPDLVAHPDELYHRLVHMHDCGFEQIASAFSDPETGGSNALEPIIVVRMEGKGRIFHTPLGHVWKGGSREAHEDPQFAEVIRRGTEWAATGDVLDGSATANSLSEAQRKAGWELLFDGKSLAGWESSDGKDPGAGWQVVNGNLRRAEAAGDLVSKRSFTDFELEFEFQLASGTNSGLKYRVQREGKQWLGPEFQVLDDTAHPKEGAKHLCASLYAVHAANQAKPTGPLRWHQARIVAQGNHLEHWIDNQRVVNTDVGSETFEAARQASKFRGLNDFAKAEPGRFLIQDHGGEVWYRSMRLRSGESLQGKQVNLFKGDGLEGWTPTGNAEWSRDGDTIIGKVGGGGQSFLRTNETYQDFIFEADVWLEVKGNSGIQFRSYLVDGRRVCGYQAEIDPSDRSWSGGIFSECENWIQNLKDNPRGRAAFQLDGWNRYRIECLGDHSRIWVNGIPTADLHDDRFKSGFIALQVHSGRQGTIHWRNPRMYVLK
mgnify:FL=1